MSSSLENGLVGSPTVGKFRASAGLEQRVSSSSLL